MSKVLQPDYVSKFQCIASDCEDTCCCGWRIKIDKDSYDKYENLKDELFSGKITTEDILHAEGSFSEVVLADNSCPFLNIEKLCRIQKKYGESYLSTTCSVFPRNYNMVNDRLELALSMSCPQAAKLALLNPEAMRFSFVEISDDSRISKIPNLNLFDNEYSNKIYPYFKDIRTFVIELLQNRNYNFEDRLIILGRFCNDLNLISSNSIDDEVLRLIKDYNNIVDSFGFDKFISSIPNQPAVMLKTLITLIEYRLKTGITGKRFLECFEKFKQGLNYSNEISDEVLADFYVKAKSNYYDNFIKQHEYIFENYFVNYAFKTNFPFGQQQTRYPNDISAINQTILSEFMLMVVHYAIIKNLLVGIAGYNKEKLSEQDIIVLIQSFDKNICNDVSYHQSLLKFFDDNHMMNIACSAILIKN